MYVYVDGRGFLGSYCRRTGIACDPAKISAVRLGMHPVQLNRCHTFCRILSPVHPKLCSTIGTSGGLDSEGGRVCMDSGKTGGLRETEILPATGSDIGFPHRVRPVYTGRGRGCQPICGWRCPKSASGRPGSCHPAVPAALLYYTAGNVGGCGTHFRSYLRGAQFTLRTDHR